MEKNAFVCDYELALASYWLNRVYSWFCHLAHRFSVRSLAVRPPFCFASCEFDLFSLQLKATLWNGTPQHTQSRFIECKWINVPDFYWTFFLRFLRQNFQFDFVFLFREKKLVFLHKFQILVYAYWKLYEFAQLCGASVSFSPFSFFFIFFSSFVVALPSFD